MYIFVALPVKPINFVAGGNLEFDGSFSETWESVTFNTSHSQPILTATNLRSLESQLIELYNRSFCAYGRVACVDVSRISVYADKIENVEKWYIWRNRIIDREEGVDFSDSIDYSFKDESADELVDYDEIYDYFWFGSDFYEYKSPNFGSMQDLDEYLHDEENATQICKLLDGWGFVIYGCNFGSNDNHQIQQLSCTFNEERTYKDEVVIRKGDNSVCWEINSLFN